MFACAKLARTPALIRAGSRIAYRPISASVLSPPETRTGQGSTVFNGAQNGMCQLIRREFQTSAISRDIDTAAKFIGAGAPLVESRKERVREGEGREKKAAGMPGVGRGEGLDTRWQLGKCCLLSKSLGIPVNRVKLMACQLQSIFAMKQRT
ncbi:hypothetical protein NN561_009177 [Cricetulus griseus]